MAGVAGLRVRRGVSQALRGVDLQLTRGSVTAVMGRNGAGKSSLLAALAGQLRAAGGRVRVGGLDPAATSPARLVGVVGLVPQDPRARASTPTASAPSAGRPTTTWVCRRAAPARCSPASPPGSTTAPTPATCPRASGSVSPWPSSSCAAPTSSCSTSPPAGLDYAAKHRLVGLLRELAATGHTVVVATHDVELAADVADRVVVLAEGEVVADGPARQILAGSPAFAPQVAKVLHPLPYLTVSDVVTALGAAS